MKYPSTKRLSSLKDPSPWYSWTDWHFSEKLDGTCVQVVLEGDFSLEPKRVNVSILSRGGNNEPPQKVKDAILAQLVPQDKLIELMEGYHQYITVFGEGFGEGVQGQVGKEYGETRFNAFAVASGNPSFETIRWWNVAAEQWFVGELGLEFVPEYTIQVDEGLSQLYSIKGLLETGQLTSTFAPTKLVEGIIARPRQTLLFPDGSRVLFKLKSEEYYKGDPQNVMDLNFRRTKKDNRS